MSSFGTTAQFEYATTLAKRAGYATLEAAAQEQTGRPNVQFNVTPFTKTQASKVISFLECKLGLPAKGAKSPDHGANESDPTPDNYTPKSRYLTARNLRRIASHLEAAPTEIDDDAKWVLARLFRLEAIEAFVRRGQPDQRLAVNGNDQIKVAHLVEYFRTEEAVADAFQVSLQTLRAWGEFLPPTHAFKAEVLTNGYVQVPRH